MFGYTKIIFFKLFWVMCSYSISYASTSKFALYVEVPTSKIEKSHADYARDSIAAELSRLNFQIITPQSVVEAVGNVVGGKDSNAHESLSENNMQSLASLLNADYFMCFTLNDFRSESKDLPRFDRKIYKHTLSANFRVIATDSASSSFGKPISVTKNIPVTSNIQIEVSKSGLINELIDDAVKELSSYIIENEKKTTPITKSTNLPPRLTSPSLSQLNSLNREKVNIQISAKVQEIVLPEINKTKDGNFIITGKNHELEAADAEVQIDGVFIGNCSSDNNLSVSPGIRRLKVTRGGYVAFERTINAYNGLKLSIQLKPTEDEIREWREQLAFLQQIKIGERLTEAEVLKARGVYEYLKNSKFEVPSNVTFKSLY